MIIAKIIMNALPEKRKEVLNTLLSILKELIKGLWSSETKQGTRKGKWSVLHVKIVRGKICWRISALKSANCLKPYRKWIHLLKNWMTDVE
jgi:hypothetical protein